MVKHKNIITYDAKKIICNTKVNINFVDDIMIMAYLLNLNIKDDLAYLANQDGNDFAYYENMKKNNFSNLETELVKRSRYLFNKRGDYKNKLASSESLNLYLILSLHLH